MHEFSKIDALIPARGGSKRIPYKNMRALAEHPLIYWTIKAAKESGIFNDVVVSTDDAMTKEYCASLCSVIDRPKEYAIDTSPDVDWIKHYMQNFAHADFFMILRPTSPFRTAQSIQRAWRCFAHDGYADSLRAVVPVKQHPGKMWTLCNNRITPLMNYPRINGQPSYNLPTQLLPEVYIQSACIEIGHENNILARNTVSGRSIMPFFMDDLESFDLNTLEDWILAEHYIKEGIVKL